MSPLTVGHASPARTNPAKRMPRSARIAAPTASLGVRVPGAGGGDTRSFPECAFHDLDVATVRGGTAGLDD
jgi:hypothetical protein